MEDDVVSSGSSRRGTTPSLVDDASIASTEGRESAFSLSTKSSFAKTSIDTHLSAQPHSTRGWFEPTAPAEKHLITSPPRLPERAARRRSHESFDDTTAESSPRVADVITASREPPARLAEGTDTTQAPKVEVDTEAQVQTLALEKRGKRKVTRQKYIMTAFLISVK